MQKCDRRVACFFFLGSKLPESLKADESQLPGVMRRSFSVSPGTAFKSLKERKMRVDEMPDVFVADLRRLLELAGHVPTDNDRDPVLLEQFLHGLPTEFEKELRLSSAGQSMKISACVEKVRALSACTARRSGGGFVAATASAASGLSGESANPEPAGKPKSAVTHGHAFYGHRTERNLAWVHRTDSLLYV